MRAMLGTLRFRAEEGSGPDVNSQAGFTEAVALAAGRELTDDERADLNNDPDRSVASGLTEESQEEPNRDEAGRFTPAAPTPETAPEGAAPTPETPAPEPSPLEKQLHDSQEFIGKQSETIGELRARLDALEKSTTETPEEPSTGIFVPNEEEWSGLTELYDNLGGPGMMSRLAMSSPEAISAGMALWKAAGDTEVASAYLYEENVDRILAAQEGSAQTEPAAPEMPPEVQEVVNERRLNAAASEVYAELGERAQVIAPHVDGALKEAGPLVKQAIGTALASGDPEQAREAFREIASLAEQRARTATGVAQAQRQDAARQGKLNAQVVNGSTRAAVGGQSDGEIPRSREEFEKLPREQRRALATKLVADQFEKTETTSVADGLTFGSR